MSEDSGVLPAFRSLAIFIAFASVFYFLLVWNPVNTFGDIRNYLEHPVRVPIEWVAVVFPVAWLIQRNHGFTVAAIVFLPISVLILTLTKPDYGAEFWRIFRYEVYLDPFYAKRGLLVCFFLLSLVVFTRILVTKRDAWDGDRRLTFALCLIIGFAVTSWEALTTSAPPRTFTVGSDWFTGQWIVYVYEGWDFISQYIYQYIPPGYQNAVRIAVSLYPFLAFFLLLFPSYRKLPKDFVRDHKEDSPIYLFVGVILGLSAWAFSAAQGGAHGMGTKVLLGVLSIPALVGLIVLGLSSIFWIPAGLVLLPAWLFWILSQPLKIAYFLVVKGPVMVLHYLHYLMVPHPVEEVVKQYEAVKSRRQAVDYGLFAEKMKKARYNLRDGIPAWWKSKNLERRLKDIMALRGRVHSEKDVADKYTEEFRKHHRENK